MLFSSQPISGLYKLDIFVFGLFGLFALASFFTGYFFGKTNFITRILSGAIGFALLFPHYSSWIGGATLFIALAYYQNKFANQNNSIEIIKD